MATGRALGDRRLALAVLGALVGVPGAVAQALAQTDSEALGVEPGLGKPPMEALPGPVAGPHLLDGVIALFQQPRTALAITAGSALLCLTAIAFMSYRTFRLRRQFAHTRRIFGKAFGSSEITLDEIPAKFSELNELIETLNAERASLRDEVRALSSGNSPTVNYFNAIRDLCPKVIAKIKEAAADPVFAKFGSTLNIESHFTAFDGVMQVMEQTVDPGQVLVKGLERGQFNAVLTIPSFLDAYLADADSLRSLRRDLRAIQHTLTAALLHQEIEIVVIPPLTFVDAADANAGEPDQVRNVRAIPAVRQRAAKAARDIPSQKFMVTDCFAPGWISQKIGSRKPKLTLYDPASWT